MVVIVIVVPLIQIATLLLPTILRVTSPTRNVIPLRVPVPYQTFPLPGLVQNITITLLMVVIVIEVLMIRTVTIQRYRPTTALIQ